jgi:outer membrane protein assembly factor BamE (lipoprotein component of BamABCDE complex)
MRRLDAKSVMGGPSIASVTGRFGRSLKRAALIGGALCLAMPLVGCLGYEGTINRGYMSADSGLNQVKPGMAAEQVLATLGTPSTTSTVGGDAWYYISQKVEQKLRFMNPSVTDQRVIAVYFKQKKVERIANYGLEDGQVIDILTRTTPTAGSEVGFIRQMLTGLLKFS